MELVALIIILGVAVSTTISTVFANNKIKGLEKENVTYENKIKLQNQEIENANGTITQLKDENEFLRKELEAVKYDFESQMAYTSEEVRILESQLQEQSEHLQSLQETGKVDIRTIKTKQEFLDKHIELSLDYMDKLLKMQNPKAEEELNNVIQDISGYRQFQKENLKAAIFNS